MALNVSILGVSWTYEFQVTLDIERQQRTQLDLSKMRNIEGDETEPRFPFSILQDVLPSFVGCNWLPLFC